MPSLFCVVFARGGIPYFLEVPDESIFLASDLRGLLAKLLVKDGEHVLVVKSIIILKHLDEDQLNILLLNCGIKTVLASRMPHEGPKEGQVAFPEVNELLFILLEHFHVSLPLRMRSFLGVIWFHKLNDLIRSMNKAAIYVHDNQQLWKLFLDISLQFFVNFQ